jgi:predicted O-methyltransferase YrrM
MNHPDQAPGITYWTDGDATTPVFQWPGEFARLLALYATRAPKRVLEIGTYHGGTLKQWLTQGTPERVVAVDLFLPRYDCRVKAAQWAQAAGVELFTQQGDSHDPDLIDDVAELGPYDWIYLDADHAYAAIAADWHAYAPLLAPGGVVVLHDIIACPVRHPEIEVPRFWGELHAAYQTTEIVDDPQAAWGGLGVVWQ